jgi:hypothetical protein
MENNVFNKKDWFNENQINFNYKKALFYSILFYIPILVFICTLSSVFVVNEDPLFLSLIIIFGLGNPFIPAVHLIIVLLIAKFFIWAIRKKQVNKLYIRIIFYTAYISAVLSLIVYYIKEIFDLNLFINLF